MEVTSHKILGLAKASLPNPHPSPSLGQGMDRFNPWLALISQACMEVRGSNVELMALMWGSTALALSVVVSSVGIYDQERLLIDITLAAFSWFAQMFGAFAGLYWIAGSLQRKTAYLLLAKPITRSQFVIGRALGIWLGLFPSLFAMVAGSALLLWLSDYTFPPSLWAAWSMLWMEAGLAIAVATLLGALVQLPIASVATAICLLLGHLHSELCIWAQHPKQPWLLQQLLMGTTWLIPNLSSLSFRQAAANHLTLAWPSWLGAMGYSSGYMMICLLLAATWLQYRKAV